MVTNALLPLSQISPTSCRRFLSFVFGQRLYIPLHEESFHQRSSNSIPGTHLCFFSLPTGTSLTTRFNLSKNIIFLNAFRSWPANLSFHSHVAYQVICCIVFSLLSIKMHLVMGHPFLSLLTIYLFELLILNTSICTLLHI